MHCLLVTIFLACLLPVDAQLDDSSCLDSLPPSGGLPPHPKPLSQTSSRLLRTCTPHAPVCSHARVCCTVKP